ncbi:hypothetical protein PINS_up007352 [Pythium insidiosum]|nr:hypothetical protein PINS_up007352 [Pythium insidiosum]
MDGSDSSGHGTDRHDDVTFESLRLETNTRERLPIELMASSRASSSSVGDVEISISTLTTADDAPSGRPSLSPSPSPSMTPSNASTTTPSPSPTTVDTSGVPSNPTLVTAVASDGSAEVSWKTPDDDGSDPILAYEVAWFDEEDSALIGTQVVGPVDASIVSIASPPPSTSTSTPSTSASTSSSTSSASASSASTSAATAVAPPPSPQVPTSTVISNLLNGRSYSFKVRARNKHGVSVWSAKSLAVSPLHPPDLCGRVACSGHGACFPQYLAPRSSTGDRHRSLGATSTDGGRCLCRPGFNPPDCSTRDDATRFTWRVSEWGECSSGCGGGTRVRHVTCVDVATNAPAADASACDALPKPTLTRICNGMECGSKLVSVKYEVEMSFDEVLFSPDAWDAFELAFTTEVSGALRIARSRLEVTAIRRGSIAVFFQILPASRVGEASLSEIVERLQRELGNATSGLRTRGTFARRIEPNGVKVSFSIADQTVAGGAEDISVLGLVGTVVVLCSFVAMFGWFLRKRHERIAQHVASAASLHRMDDKSGSSSSNSKEMKRMGIRTMT